MAFAPSPPSSNAASRLSATDAPQVEAARRFGGELKHFAPNQNLFNFGDIGVPA